MAQPPSASDIAENIVAAGKEWSECEAAASWLEESRKSVRAQIAIENFSEAGSAAKAELIAESSQKYLDHLKSMVEARRKANIARVNYEGGKLWTDMLRTEQATARAEMQMR